MTEIIDTKTDTLTETVSLQTEQADLKSLQEEITKVTEEKDKSKIYSDFLTEKLGKYFVEDANKIDEIKDYMNSGDPAISIMSMLGIDPVETVISSIMEGGPVAMLMIGGLKKKFHSKELDTLLGKISDSGKKLSSCKNESDFVNLGKQFGIDFSVKMNSSQGNQTTPPKDLGPIGNETPKDKKYSEIMKELIDMKVDVTDVGGIVGSGFLLSLLKGKKGKERKPLKKEDFFNKDFAVERKLKDITEGNVVMYMKDNKEHIALASGEIKNNGKISLLTSMGDIDIQPDDSVKVYSYDLDKLPVL